MNWKVVLGLMIFFAVMMASSYTMLIPFLPLYLTTELGASEESVNLWSGAVFAITFAISAIMTPLWGRLSDRTGRKLMILRSSIMLTVVYFVGGLVQTPLQLFFMRVLQGFAAGLWPACMAMLSAYMPRDKLGLSMGLMQSANICGGIIGPLLGGVLATLVGMRNSFFVGAAGLFIITLLTLFCLKEPPREEAAEAAAQNKGAAKGENGKGEASVADSQAAAASLFKNRSVIFLLIAAGLTNMAIMQLQPVLTLYLRKLDGSTADNLMLLSGLVFSLGGLAGAIAAPLWGRQGQRLGFFRTMTAAFLLAGAIMALQSLPRSLWLFALLQFCAGLGFSGIFPSANSLLVLLTPPQRRGESFALFFSAQQVGGAVGPLLGGLWGTFWQLSYVFCCSGTLLFATGLWLLWRAPAALRIGAPQRNETKESAERYLKQLKEQALAELKEEKKLDGDNSGPGRAPESKA